MHAAHDAARVRVRGRLWTLIARTRYADCEAIRLCGAGPDNVGEVRTLLLPFDRPIAVVRRPTLRTTGPRHWLHALRRAALQAHPFGGLRSADAIRIRLLPYQLEPALAIFRCGATRLLIADEVGLGKTIQAGLILRELADRIDGFRAIVLMPAALRDQWRQELRDRFDLPSVRADSTWLLETARELPADVNPWSPPGVYLSSYDFVKRPEVLRPIEDVTWDAAIFDEAHAASPATDRRVAADAIASRSRRLVLLTATPHSGDSTDFDALCCLGCSSGHREPLLHFQRSPADTGWAPSRRTTVMTVRPAPAERRMHRLLERYASELHRSSSRGDPPATLAATVLRKRALSSAGSLLASAVRRRDLLARLDAPRALQLPLPLGEEDPLADEVSDATLAVPGLEDGVREQRLLSAVVRAARAASMRETKTAFLLRFVRRVGEPVLIFTEYRDTLLRLSAALQAVGLHAAALHGGMPHDERVEVQRTFNEGHRLLLATDAAAEGLNLHRRCRIVIHYELPWSPARLQQRTGRVDRIGQTRTVHEILLVAGDTAERLVLAPLARRVAAARSSTAGAARLFQSLTESRVARAMLTSEPLRLDEVPAPDGGDNPPHLRSEAIEEVQRLLERRAWGAQSGSAGRRDALGSRRILAVLRRRRGLHRNASRILVFTVTLQGRDGHAVHAELVPVLADDRFTDEDVRDQLGQVLRERLAHTAQAHASAAGLLARRERELASVIPRAARQLVQAGLFDRRAVRDADARGRVSGVLAAEAAARISAIEPSGHTTSSITLAATLLLAPLARR